MIRRRLLNDVKIPCDQFWAGCDEEPAAEAGAAAIVRQAHLLQLGVISPTDWKRAERGEAPQHLSPAATSDFPRSLQWPAQCGATRDGTHVVLDMPEVAPAPSAPSPLEEKASEEKASEEKAAAAKAAARDRAAAAKAEEEERRLEAAAAAEKAAVERAAAEKAAAAKAEEAAKAEKAAAEKAAAEKKAAAAKAAAAERAAAKKAAEEKATAAKTSKIGWTLDPRVHEEPGQFTGCPDGQRNAAESECVAAVQDALLSTGETLGHHDLKVVDAGADGWVPAGCSYSRGHGQRAMFNRNPAGRSSGSYPLVCIEVVQPPKSNLTAVVILLGQSNLVGRGRGDSLDPALLKSLGERDLGYYPANDACGSSCNLDGNDCSLPAFMRRNCSGSEEPTLSEQPLQPVPGQAWEQAILGSETRFGPELTLGLSLSVDAPSAYTRVVLIKRAILGAGIASFAEGQPLYNGLLRDYARVVELYGSAQTVPIGVLWMQGESDAMSASDASAYSARLRGFISRVRSDLKAPSLPFVIPQLPGHRPFPGSRPFQDQVEAAFTAAAAEVPRVRYVLGEWRNGSEAHVPTPTPQHLMDAMAGTGVTMGSRLLADMASKMSCAHYSSSSVLRIGVAVARNMAELQGWDHRDISANVSSWVEFQDREEASWATLRPADWDTCDGDAGLQSLIERLDAVSSDGPLQLNHSSHGSWSDEMG